MQLSADHRYSGNIGTDLYHFLLGLSEIIFQGIEACFQVLAEYRP
jgi:hypothetical protein